MSNDLNTIASYLPNLLRQQLAKNPSALTAPQIETFSAAFLFGDITGFTPLTQRLTQKGAEGVEELSRLLNGYFDKLISLITAHGGDILKIAGDAVLVVWPAGEKLPIAVQRAAQCALAIQAELHNYETFEGARLAMKIGLSGGPLSLAQLGGVFGRWEAIASGIPITQASIAEERCQPGQVILSPEAWALLLDVVQVEMVEKNGKQALKLLRVQSPLALNPVSLVPLALEALTAARAYIPGAILQHLASGQSAFLSELRRLTVIFVNLPGFERIENLEEAQTLMQTLQRALYHYEGSVNQLLVDDKGTTLVAALGLPPFAHEDDPARGLLVALEMAAGLQTLNQRYAISVTSGQVYCGERGNAYRREYALLGDSVNMAARLMQAVLKTGVNDIYCDAATYQAATQRIDFATLAPVTVKGKTEPIAIYRPQQEKSAILQPRRELIGRKAEKNVLSNALQSLLRGEPQGTIILEGEAGLGKSRLMEEARHQAQATGLTFFDGAGDAIEHSSAYHAWRNVIRAGFGLLPDETLQEQHAKIEALLPERWRAYAPLLNVVLPLNFPETESTAALTQQTRLDQTRDMFNDLLLELRLQGPTVLLLEDAHWFDTASWSMVITASQLARKIPLLLIVTTRPMQDANWPEYIQLQEQPETRLLRLGPLAEAETTAFIRQHLQTTHVGTALNAFIEERAEGNPFFADEILLVLQESGLLNHSADTCDLKATATTQNIALPNTIHGLITNRIDRLKPAEQMTLKVASVLGRSFSLEMLRAIYPINAEQTEIDAHLKTLQERDFIISFSRESYIFKHALTRDAVYNQMLFAQRRKLHRAIAEWVEQNYVNDLEPHYALMAYHWEYAIGNPQDDPALSAKALDALEKAGEHAAANLIYTESAEFFSRALALTAKFSPELTNKLLPKLRQMGWMTSVGVAQVNLGRMREARQTLEQAARLGGHAMPETNTALYLVLIHETLIQIWHRLRPTFLIPKTDKNEALNRIFAEIHIWLIEPYFFNNQFIQTVVTTLKVVNITENFKIPPSALIVAYGALNFFVGMIRENRLADTYQHLASRIKAPTNEPTLQSGLHLMLMIRFLGQGEWGKFKMHNEKALAMLNPQAMAYQVRGSLFTLSATYDYLQARYQEQLEKAEIVSQLGRIGNNLELQSWGLSGRVMFYTALGQFSAMQADIDKFQALLFSIPDSNIANLFFHTYQAKLALTLQRWEKAVSHTKELDRLLSDSLFPVYSNLFAETICAEVPLTQWQLADSSTDPANIKRWRASAKRACQKLTQYARIYPIGKPDALRFQGDYDWLNGNPAKARRNWQASLDAALQLEMPHHAALAHWSLGHLPDPEQSSHRQAAREILEGLGALAYFEYLQSLL